MMKEFLVEMKQHYPFGQLGQIITEETSVKVIKTLPFSSANQKNMIQQIVHFIKSAKHDCLVNLLNIFENQTEVQLYYQYVPFRLEKWLVDINEDLIEVLEQQMEELAEHLCRSSIKFKFDPLAVGLSESMGIKYFLNEFQLDVGDWEVNFEEKKKEIREFFNTLSEPKSPNEKEEKQRVQSISTNGSLTPADEAPLVPQAFERKQKGKNLVLSSKVQSSKKRCQEIIDRFRKMNNK